VPHHVVVTLLYEFPQFRNKPFANTFLGGWKVGALETYESGPVFTVISAVNATNAFSAGSQRPNILRDASLPADQRSVARWFDTSAFAAPAPFTFGNSPRSGLRGAPILSTDATLEKRFSLTERYKLDVRAEAYNLLNHTMFNVPGFTFGAAGFGAVSTARSPRTVQLAGRLSF
jgi:hypothetical protein